LRLLRKSQLINVIGPIADGASKTDTTPLGLFSFDTVTQGSRAARQPWAKLHNRFVVQSLKFELD